MLVWIDATDFSTFRALKIILIENAIKIGLHLYLFFVESELVLDVSDPMPARTLFYHYQVGHCREPTRTLFVAGSELVRVRVDPEPINLGTGLPQPGECLFNYSSISSNIGALFLSSSGGQHVLSVFATPS